MSEIQLFALIKQMSAVLESGDEIYKPSLYWQELNTRHEDSLYDNGIDQFKNTQNLQYFNFIMSSVKDGLFKRQIQLWPTHFDDSMIETIFENKEILPPHMAEIYRIYVSLLWGLTKHHDQLGQFEQLSEPLVGNPFRIRRGDGYISQDLCNSYREYQAVVIGSYPERSPNGRVIGELGSGYGRVGYVFGMLSNARYCFFDIPPALAIAQAYFQKIFPDRKIFGFRDFRNFAQVEAEIASSQFAFFTANQIEQFPDSYFDTFINISSLHEMKKNQIAHYLNQFDRLTKTSIYLKQWILSGNHVDNIIVTANDYPLPDHWQAAIDQIDLVAPLFFERLLLRQ